MRFKASLTLLVLAVATRVAVAAGGYGIQPGDLLEISVWREEDLAREVLVRPDGGISFPLVGDIVAQGRTVDELRGIISERLQKYIPEPEVTVAVKQIAGNTVFVIGKVARPGAFIMGQPIDVMQALSMAGGTTTFAALNKIRILRRVEGRETAIPFRYAEVEKGENLEQNILLQPGDVVVVP